MTTKQRCFACDKPLGKNPSVARCEDEQTVLVGSECFKHIKRAGDAGWQPPLGGPRLYVLNASGLKMYPLIINALRDGH